MGPTPARRAARASSDSVVPAGAESWIALRPQRVMESPPRSPESQANSLCWQTRQSRLLAEARDVDGAEAVFPELDDGEMAADGVDVAAEDLERFASFDRGDHTYDRAEDAGGVAGGRGAGGRCFGEEAGEAGGFAGDDRHALAFGADRAAVDPGLAMFDGEVVHQEAGGEVVGAVDDDIDVGGEGLDVGVGDVGDDRLDGDGGVDEAELVGGGDGFGEGGGDVGFVVEELPLQIVELDEVAVDDADEADAGADECAGDDRAEGAAAADERAAGGETAAGLLRREGRSGSGGRSGLGSFMGSCVGNR